MRKFVLFILVVTVGLMASALYAQDADVGLRVSSDTELGSFLVSENGMTLYIFTNDEMGVSNCNDDCATNWPPLTVESAEAELDAAPGVAAGLSVIERADGTFQVAYQDMPLYFFAGDQAPGDTNGQERGDVWFVASVEALGLGANETLGTILTDAEGITLYLFTNDEMGVSNCYEDCAAAWPPLMADAMDALPAAVEGVSSGLSTVERTDGTFQVAYNDIPLYYFAGDAAPGDVNGQGIGEVWFVVNVDALQAAEHAELGNILADAEGMTLYTFTRDENGESACYEDCATNWPALTVESADDLPAAQPGVPYAFGTTERTDGTFQVTYNNQPLYYFAGDTAPGDANGQARGDVWFVVNLGSEEEM